MKKMTIPFSLALLLVFALSTSWAGYPEKPIELVVPFGAGGSTDLGARVLANALPKIFGQPVVVVNKSGGGGQIGSAYVMKAKPDGYTMLANTIGPATIYPALHRKAPLTYNSLTPVARTEVIPCILVTRPDDRWKNLKEFVEFLKKNPGKVKYAIAGMGTVSELGIKAFFSEAGIPLANFIGIPFEGTAEAIAAVLGKHADFLYVNLTPCLEHIEAKTLVALGTSTSERLSSLQAVPTLEEQGYKKSSIMGWKGISGPPALSPEIVAIWEKAIQESLKDPELEKFQKKLGAMPAYLGHSDFAAFLELQFKTFREVAIENNLLAD